MNSAQVATLLSQVVSLLNVSLEFADNNRKYRDMVAKAVSEGRDLNPEEVEILKNDAQAAVDKL